MRGVVHPVTLFADGHRADMHEQALVCMDDLSWARCYREYVLNLATGDRCTNNQVRAAYRERSIIARDRGNGGLGTSLARDIPISVTRHFRATDFRIVLCGFWRHAFGFTRISWLAWRERAR